MSDYRVRGDMQSYRRDYVGSNTTVLKTSAFERRLQEQFIKRQQQKPQKDISDKLS